MAMFGTKKTKPSEGSELVLAYLEDAQRVRATLMAVDPKGRELPATFASITEDRVTLAVQGRLLVEKGDTVGLLFYLDGLRLKAKGKFLELKNGNLVMDLPAKIELAERRKKPRARLNQREGATAIALTGLFDGVGLTGTVENISEGGMCLKVGRAMNVKTQGPMHMGPNLLSVGQALMLIKISKLPKCPLIELGGTVASVVSEGSFLSVGITFESGKEGLLGPVRSLVSSRTSAIPSSLPAKARRSQEAPSQGVEVGVELAPPHAAPKKEPEPTPTAPEPVAPAPVEALEPVASPEPAPEAAPAPELPHRHSALLRVKKRTRNLLLAMHEGPDREALEAFLSADGYGQVLVAGTLTELLEHVDRAQLVFVDDGVAELQGLLLASFLRSRMDDALPAVILAEATVDSALVLGAHEIGVAQILVKPYDLDSDFLRMIEEHLGIG